MALAFHPLAEIFPLIGDRDLAALTEDIREHGVREPLMLHDGKILDGRNRYRALLALQASGAVLGPGWGAHAGATIRDLLLTPNLQPHIFHRYMPAIDGADPVAYVLSKNLVRRHLNESQRAMVAARIANLRHGGDRRSNQWANLPVVTQGEAGSALNVSERSVRSARLVLDHGGPDLVRAVDLGTLAVSEAAKAARLSPELQRQVVADAEAGRLNVVRTVIKQAARSERETNLGGRQLALPDKRYGVILADPEWQFGTWSERGLDRSADNHYSTSALETIASRPVQDIAADDCVLCLWITAPHLEHGFQVMNAWGFDYVSRVVWHKEGPPGTGYWFRDVAEEMLIGTRGNVPAPAPGTQWESVKRGAKGAHSAKPDWQYEFGETFFPTLPKIELNARERRPGWDAWGFEAGGRDEGSAGED